MAPLQPSETDYDAGGVLDAAAGPRVTCSERRTKVVVAGCNSAVAYRVVEDIYPEEAMYGLGGLSSVVSGMCTFEDPAGGDDALFVKLQRWLRDVGTILVAK